MEFIIDIDLTVVDAITGPTGWIKWIEKQGGEYIPEYANWEHCPGEPLPYGVFDMFEDRSIEEIDPYLFWGQHGLYQSLTPYDGVVETIEILLEEGHTVTFCSFCVDDHWTSKKKFITDHFDSDCDVILVDNPRNKMRIHGDIYIDDRAEYLSDMRNTEAKTILKSSRFQQKIDATHLDMLGSWSYESLVFLINGSPKKLSITESIAIVTKAQRMVGHTPGYRIGQAIYNLLPSNLADYDRLNNPEHPRFYNTISTTYALEYFYKNLVESI